MKKKLTQKENGKILRKYKAKFSPEVYEHLPEILKDDPEIEKEQIEDVNFSQIYSTAAPINIPSVFALSSSAPSPMNSTPGQMIYIPTVKKINATGGIVSHIPNKNLQFIPKRPSGIIIDDPEIHKEKDKEGRNLFESLLKKIFYKERQL